MQVLTHEDKRSLHSQSVNTVNSCCHCSGCERRELGLLSKSEASQTVRSQHHLLDLQVVLRGGGEQVQQASEVAVRAQRR